MAKILNFLDLSSRTRDGTPKTFTTSNYTLKKENGKHFAIAIAPSGKKCFRLVPTDFKK